MKKFLAVVTVLLLLLASAVYVIVNGTPWGRVRMERQAADYLKEKYAWENVIDETHYTMHGRYYWFEAHRKGTDIKFGVYGPRGGREEMTDEYVMANWEEEVVAGLRPFLQKTYPDAFRAAVVFQTDFIADEGPRPITELPALRDIRDRVNELHVDLYINRRYDLNRDAAERQALFDLFQLIRAQGYQPDMVEVTFDDEIETEENQTRFFYRAAELENLKSKEDILPATDS